MIRNKLYIIMLFLGICSIARGQTSQYWFDSNYDGAVSSGISNGSIPVDVSALQPGVHTLHYLYKTKQGVPSSTYSKSFLVPEFRAKGSTKAEYWFDHDYAKRTETTTLSGIITIDASALKPGVHTMQYHQTNDDGVVSSTYAYAFLVPETQNTTATKGEYWFDSNYEGRKALALSDKAVALDLTGLTAGLHSVHYHALNSQGLPSVAYTKLFWIAAEPSVVKAYHYWVNDLTDQLQTVLLDTPVSSYKLTAQIEVPEVPVRKEKYHFEIRDGQPKLFAKNTISIMFENADGTSVRHEQDYVDYRVSEDIEATLLNNGDKPTIDKPEGLVWFKMEVHEGDSLAFKADRKCTMRLFSPSGLELWTANGDAVKKMSGARADIDGTFYLVLQDVTETNAKNVTIEYFWDAKKLPGDVNEDGSLDAMDIVLMTNLIVAGTYDKRADLNEDGLVNISDLIIVINTIMGNEK